MPFSYHSFSKHEFSSRLPDAHLSSGAMGRMNNQSVVFLILSTTGPLSARTFTIRPKIMPVCALVPVHSGTEVLVKAKRQKLFCSVRESNPGFRNHNAGY